MIIRQSAIFALGIGTLLALYISLTTFWPMPYDIWLALHNVLVITSLIMAAFLGYQNSNHGLSLGSLILSIAVFFSIIMILYLGSYTVTTMFLIDKMTWIPFFYKDYNYHGFTSAAEYLRHEDNYAELLKLQIFSLVVSSGMYFIVGGIGYIGRTLLERVGKSSSLAL
jgi:hypothetical protein